MVANTFGADNRHAQTIKPVSVAKRRAKNVTHLASNDFFDLKSTSIIAVIATLTLIFTDVPWWIVASIGMVALVLSYLHRQYQIKRRVQFILDTPFPGNLWHNKTLKELPLSDKDRHLVDEGLRDFFLIHALKPNKPLSMPSKYVDDLWHAFILDTRSYEHYCKKAFGKTFHHVPDYMFLDRKKNVRMYTYQSACKLQEIDPARPVSRVPRLFAIDSCLNDKLNMGANMVGAVALLALMDELSSHYETWHKQASAQSGASGGDAIEIDDDGDISSGWSGDGFGGDGCGSSCGGGCGGCGG